MSESGIGLSLRAGALFFIIVSLVVFFIMTVGWTGYINLVTILILATATTYLAGGAVVLLRNDRVGMLPIFIINILVFILLAAFFLFYMYGYFTLSLIHI